MGIIIELNRLNNESEESYIWRIGQAKDSGILDLSWEQIADLINKNFRNDETEYRTESAYRKVYTQAKRFKDAGVFTRSCNDEYLHQMDELRKAKIQFYDQRREYNKLLVSEARSNHLTEELIKVAQQLDEHYPLLTTTDVVEANMRKSALLCLADWHYGEIADNVWNRYNTQICLRRVSKLVCYVKEYLSINQINSLHIVLLGDAAHGAIHTSCRVRSEEATCDQIMHVSELTAQVINELSKFVNSIEVYSCYGNHLRTIQNKKDSIDADNMETLIPWWLKQRLQNNQKVHFVDNDYKEFTFLNILGSNICCVHGNNDNFRDFGVTANTIFTQKFGKPIDYTISADKHHLEEFEQFGIESILVRSLCGTDDYANQKRLYSKPGQTLIIFNDDYGREATYHIVLD